jgi:hypothetical protein
MMNKYYFIRHYLNIQLILLTPLTYMLKFSGNTKCYYYNNEVIDQTYYFIIQCYLQINMYNMFGYYASTIRCSKIHTHLYRL